MLLKHCAEMGEERSEIADTCNLNLGTVLVC